jgi:hypothetical protein
MLSLSLSLPHRHADWDFLLQLIKWKYKPTAAANGSKRDELKLIIQLARKTLIKKADMEGIN